MNITLIIDKAVEAMHEADRVTSKRLTYRDLAQAAYSAIEHAVRVDEFARSIHRTDAAVTQIVEALRAGKRPGSSSPRYRDPTNAYGSAADFIEREFTPPKNQEEGRADG